MKKAIITALALSVTTLIPGMANAAEEVGSPGVDQYTTGSLGVGVTNPTRKLSVRVSADNTHALSIQNAANTSECVTFTVDASGRGLLRVRDKFNSIRAEFWAGNQNYVLEKFGVGTAAPTKKLDVVGNAGISTDLTVGTTLNVGTTMSAAVVEIRGSGNDLAETFAVSTKNLKPGMVVSIDPKNAGALMQSHEAYDRKVAGIISGAGDLHAGINLGDIPTSANEQSIALTGRAWCWVDTSLTGAVQPGDALTTSTTPGHAMKAIANAQGASIGKAMTSLESGKGLVLVLINLH